MTSREMRIRYENAIIDADVCTEHELHCRRAGDFEKAVTWQMRADRCTDYATRIAKEWLRGLS